MKVTLVGYTEFVPPYIKPDDEFRWKTDACGGEALAEFAGRITPNATLAERLWAKVDFDGPRIIDTPCYVWTGYICKDTGYGKISNRPGNPIGTHVAAFVLANGSVPIGMQVLHECDYRPCVRHIYAGTQAQNMQDAVDRGRHRPSGCHGSRVGTSKLTESEVAEIKRRLRSGEQGRSIARELDLTDSVISRIKTGQTWSHVA